MGIAMEILEGLWDTTYSYHGVQINLLGIPHNKKYHDSYIRNELSRLHKKRLVDNKQGKWSITKSGKKYFNTRRLSFIHFDSPFQKGSPKNLLVMFDIPETRKKERFWFRKHLIKFQYRMIQKSVWVGPSPLPKEFKNYLKEIKLDSCIKNFKLAKPYQV